MKRKGYMTIGAKWLILTAGSVIMLLPYIWMVFSSSKTNTEMMRLPLQFFPDRWTLDNYTTVLGRMSFGRYYLNTIFVTFTTVLLQLFFNSLAAFVFAKMHFPGRDKLFGLLLTLLMIPPQMTLIANYKTVDALGWLDSYKALIIPGIISVYGIFFLRQFFLTIPNEMLESARIDGAGYFRIYGEIMLPLCSNAMVAYGIFALLGQWNELMWPMTMTSSDSVRVLSLALSSMQGQVATENNLIMAGAVMATLPMILVFIAGQRSLMEGIALGGLKA